MRRYFSAMCIKTYSNVIQRWSTAWQGKCFLRCVQAIGYALLFTATTSAVHADERIGVMHKAPEAKSLPLTSNWMPIAIELTNTKSTDLKVRLVGARDGRLIDIAFPKGILNEEDRPLYQIEVPSPAAAMAYQFIVHQPDGQLTTSDRFVVQRACVQNFKVDVSEGSNDAAFQKQVGELVSKAKLLERDRANFDAAAKILDELKKNIPG